MEEEFLSTPPELLREAEKTSNYLLPEKSRHIYEQTYKFFTDWKKDLLYLLDTQYTIFSSASSGKIYE